MPKRRLCSECERPLANWGTDKHVEPEASRLCWIPGGAKCLVDAVALLRARLAAVGGVLAENGCDCPSEDTGAESCSEQTCEEAGHEPCLAHRVERAMKGAA